VGICACGFADESVCVFCNPAPDPFREPSAPKKPKPSKRRRSTAPVDPFQKRLMEYGAGIRCLVCDDLKLDPRGCLHRRVEAFHNTEQAIDAFLAEHGDGPHARAAHSAAASTLRRASLRAGYRDMPEEKATVHQVVMAGHRAQVGQTLEWRRHRGGTEDLPL